MTDHAWVRVGNEHLGHAWRCFRCGSVIESLYTPIPDSFKTGFMANHFGGLTHVRVDCNEAVAEGVLES
jgi:hypothetical protein